MHVQTTSHSAPAPSLLTLGPHRARRKAIHFIFPMLLCVSTALAAPVTGTITNGTTGKPSPGDTVAVVNMARSMDEIAHATSALDGTFQVTVPDDGQILLHVTHRGADYFKTISPGTRNAAIEVFDSAPKVPGITGEALVLRFETDPTAKLLTVSENFFVQNSSAPPRTEFGGNTLDFYLPKDAKVTQSLASAPGGLPTTVKLTPVDASTGHFAYTFPIRPGETRFQVAYTLPYTGSRAFSLKLSLPTGDVAVMLPKAMQFTGPLFQPISPDPSSQSYDAHQPDFTQPIAFTVSGSGQLPQIPDTPQANQQANSPSTTQNPSAQPGAQPTDNRPGGGLGIPDDPEGTNDPWSKYKWWIVGGLGLALAGGAGIMLRNNPAASSAATTLPAPTADITAPAGMYSPTATTPAAPPNVGHPLASASLLEALKEELFELEKDHAAGRVTAAEYANQKAALDLILRRALTRASSTAATTDVRS
ncbi:MAG TPA: carboxypeptidase regulatory-like domain-containing protein [Acidobacteriaceae bacterium]|nr:carboxypeptidase regulatory-like domain-containing protein [Acidobacteriaceae bacterium]